MLVYSRLQQQSNHRPVWGGILVVGFLCLLAAWSLDPTAEYSGSDTERNSRVVSVDMPLHASSEHSFSLKRYFSRYKDQPKSAEPIEPLWVLRASEIILALPLIVANTHKLIFHPPHFGLLQLQTLNISRAPPIV